MEKTGNPIGPTVGAENNFLSDTTGGVGGKNSRGLVASYPALTFFGQGLIIEKYFSV